MAETTGRRGCKHALLALGSGGPKHLPCRPLRWLAVTPSWYPDSMLQEYCPRSYKKALRQFSGSFLIAPPVLSLSQSSPSIPFDILPSKHHTRITRKSIFCTQQFPAARLLPRPGVRSFTAYPALNELRYPNPTLVDIEELYSANKNA